MGSSAQKGLAVSKHTLAILIGGVLPALLYGVAGVLQKTASRTGIGPGPYVLIIGLVATAIGGAITLVTRDTAVTWAGGARTAGFAVLWSAAVVAIMLALGRYEGPVSVIVPLYNMNTLIAVLLGLLVLGEWDGVNGWRLIGGAMLIVAGGALAGTSVK
jgi:transporter family protein